MIALTSEQDKKQLKEHALELLEKHNYEGLVTLVEVLNDTDFELKDKNKALIWAAYRGYLGTIKYLVEHGADIHDDEEPLKWAAEYGHLEIVKYLVEHGADISYAVRGAEKYEHIEVVEYLQEVLKNDRSHK